MEKQISAVEWLVDMLDIDKNDSSTKDVIQQAKQMESTQRGYSKEDVLKAGEIGEINHYDYEHIVSLLDEARELNNSKSE